MFFWSAPAHGRLPGIPTLARIVVRSASAPDLDDQCFLNVDFLGGLRGEANARQAFCKRFFALLLTAFLERSCSVKGRSTTSLGSVGAQLSYKFQIATTPSRIDGFLWGAFFLHRPVSDDTFMQPSKTCELLARLRGTAQIHEHHRQGCKTNAP